MLYKIKYFDLFNLGINQYGQIVGFIWCHGPGIEERVPLLTDLHGRLTALGNMSEFGFLDKSLASSSSSSSLSLSATCVAPLQTSAVTLLDTGNEPMDIVPIPNSTVEKWKGPIFCSDLCCSDVQCFLDAGFKNPIVLGDVYHITERMIETLNKANLTQYFMCIKELRQAFSSTKPGRFDDADEIVKHINTLKAIYEPLGVWTEATSKKYETQKQHIYKCLAIPEVSISIYTIKRICQCNLILLSTITFRFVIYEKMTIM